VTSKKKNSEETIKLTRYRFSKVCSLQNLQRKTILELTSEIFFPSGMPMPEISPYTYSMEVREKFSKVSSLRNLLREITLELTFEKFTR